MPKKTERGDSFQHTFLWDIQSFGTFQHTFCCKTSKKCRGDPLEKISKFAEKIKGGSLWSRPVWYVTRKNRKNLFGSVR